MKPQHRHVNDTQAAFKQLSAELGNLVQIKSGKYFFLLRPGKSILLVGTNPVSSSSRGIRIRHYNQFTLAYTTIGDPPLDHPVEVVQDQNGFILFREGHKVLTPQQLAMKLVALVVEP